MKCDNIQIFEIPTSDFSCILGWGGDCQILWGFLGGVLHND